MEVGYCCGVGEVSCILEIGEGGPGRSCQVVLSVN